MNKIFIYLMSEENENDIKKTQKIPKGPKKKDFKIKNEDKERIKKYYVELDNFYKNNNEFLKKTIQDTNYLCNYDKDNKLFFLNKFDNNKFESFGVLKNGILFLSLNEVFYLNQIGLIKIEEEENLIYENIDLINLYSYLRRSGKIIKCCDLLWKEKDNNNIKKIYNKYFLVFNDLEKYKRKLVDYIIFQNSSKEINFNVLTNIFKDSEQILNIYENKNQSYKILLALSNKITITFLKINKDPFPSNK
jgi:hypothetical protein